MCIRDRHIEASEGMVVTADRRRLEQALDNLVENAFRYGEGPVTSGPHKSPWQLRPLRLHSLLPSSCTSWTRDPASVRRPPHSCSRDSCGPIPPAPTKAPV